MTLVSVTLVCATDAKLGPCAAVLADKVGVGEVDCGGAGRGGRAAGGKWFRGDDEAPLEDEDPILTENNQVIKIHI